MSSRIEQMIEEIEAYIDGCKSQPLSNTKIIVDRERLMEMITELKLRTPEEIKKYQNILKNREEILGQAKNIADSILLEAKQQTNAMVNETEIVQQAYAQANEILQQVTAQANQILESANRDANAIRMGAIQYTDNMLAETQTIIASTLENAAMKYESFHQAMASTYERIRINRTELFPPQEQVQQPIAQGNADPIPSERVDMDGYEMVETGEEFD